MEKPFSESCERNKDPILEVIAPLLNERQHLLEIGSGTGQHAAYFAENIPTIHWHTSDRMENHWAIKRWIGDANLTNLSEPFELDVLLSDWPDKQYDAAFTANTAHIMPWEAVLAMIEGVAKILTNKGIFIIYGPFNYQGQFTSESNARFETWLKNQAPHQGIRDFEAVSEHAKNNHMHLLDDISMPANNRILVFQKH